MTRNLLASSVDCHACGRSCRLVKRKTTPEGKVWKCPRKGCQKEISLRKGSFFANSHLPIEKILRLIHLWASKTPLRKMIDEVKVKYITLTAQFKTAVDWYNFLQDESQNSDCELDIPADSMKNAIVQCLAGYYSVTGWLPMATVVHLVIFVNT